MKHSQYGVVNWFVRQALDGKPIQVFGDGRIKRDFLYVDDCVEALLQCARSERAYGEILNVGVDRPTTFRELAELLTELCAGSRWEFAPFTPERKAQEPGDFYSDISKIRGLVGWDPVIALGEGLRRTLAYYRANRRHYWTPPEPAPLRNAA
jgi:UDP-glucose 4-epimerase